MKMFLKNKENISNHSTPQFPKENIKPQEIPSANLKNLTKHPFNKRFSVGAQLEHPAPKDSSLKIQDINRNRLTDYTEYETQTLSKSMNMYGLEQIEEEDKIFISEQKIAQNDSPISEEVTPRAKLSNIRKSENNEIFQEKSNEMLGKRENVKEVMDPLEKYRGVHKLFRKSAAEPPKEIVIDHNRKKKIIGILVLCFVGLLLLNNYVFRRSVDMRSEGDLQEEGKGKVSRMNDIEKIYESSNQITDGYKKLGYQIYQRLKIEVLIHRSISLNKLEDDLVERYGENLREKIWPFVTSFRNEENEIVEKVDQENDEKIWTVRSEDL